MKTRIFTAIAVLLCATALFTGCKKDSEKSDYLVGTTWVYVEGDDKNECKTSMIFAEDTVETKMEQKHFDPLKNEMVVNEPESFSCGYSYKAPIVTLTYPDGQTMDATVEGNTMTRIIKMQAPDGSIEDMAQVFTKQ